LKRHEIGLRRGAVDFAIAQDRDVVCDPGNLFEPVRDVDDAMLSPATSRITRNSLCTSAAVKAAVGSSIRRMRDA
jgi:hypothetical protein